MMNTLELDIISKQAICSGLSYPNYRKNIDDLLAIGKSTGIKQTEKRVEFTKLNVQRMNRLDKTIALLPALAMKAATLQKKQTWLLLAQGWCGDCAQLIPVIAKIAEVGSSKIDLRIINPDECPDMMEAFLTDGARSVPKLIVADSDSLNVLAVWGPRPEPAQQILRNWKNSRKNQSWEEFEKELHTWYAKDQTLTAQRELLEVMTKTQDVA